MTHLTLPPTTPPRRPPVGPPTIELEGVDVASVTEAEAVASIMAASRGGRGGWVLTPNVDQLRRISRERDLAVLAQQVDLAVADGMPLVWASRLAGRPLPERVAGSNLIWSLTAAAAEAGSSVYLLGGDPGVADRAAAIFGDKWPQLRIAGTHCPPVGFERDGAARAAIASALRAAQPDIVFVGLGFPKQERLIAELRSELPRTWFLGIGISLGFVSGDNARAPGWMHRLGLEWVHRLVSEPRRLFRRYVIEDLPFVVPFLLRSAGRGLRRRLATHG